MNSFQERAPEASEATTIPSALSRQVALAGERTALRFKQYGLWRDVSWQRYGHDVKRLALGLLSLGLESGDRVAVIGDNSYEWVLADLAVQSCAAVTVGLYTTNSWQQCRHILNHSGSRFLFVQNAEQLDKWLHFRDQSEQLERVIVWELEGLRDFRDAQVLSFPQLLQQGERAGPALEEQLEARKRKLQGDDLAVLVYTSGTTGDPKGVMLSHRNVMWAGEAVATFDPNLRLGPEDDLLSFLPLCHIFERLFSVFAHLQTGYVVNFVESPETVAQNLREVSPTLGYGVPRLWEKLASQIELRMQDATWFKRLAYRSALGLKSRRERSGLEPLDGSFLSRAAEWVVSRKLRERLGLERMRAAITGAAPISPEVLRFFSRIGLEMIEGYGQTESSGIISGTRLGEARFGFVGKPLPGVEVRIATDGEILVRSPGVFQGYYRESELTRLALTPDGWLQTGDIGVLDPDGYLGIIDRKKDLLITAGGKNIAPQAIENKLKFSPFIYDAVLVGEGRKFLSALVVLDEENVARYVQDHRIACATYAEMAADPLIERLIRHEIDRVNRELSRAEAVKKFRILPKRLHEEDGEVTPTLKVKRNSICDCYSDLVESMYSE